MSLGLNCPHNEMKLKKKQFQNSFKPNQSAKTAVKRFSCFSQSQFVSVVYAKHCL